jgi:hypothetical protein
MQFVFAIPLLVLAASCLFLAAMTVREMRTDQLVRKRRPLSLDVVAIKRAASPFRFWATGLGRIAILAYFFTATTWIAIKLIFE